MGPTSAALRALSATSPQDIPTSAAALLGRLIPVNMAGALDLNLTVRHIDETAEEPPPQPDVKPGFPRES
jgi:hypothetical protein